MAEKIREVGSNENKQRQGHANGKRRPSGLLSGRRQIAMVRHDGDAQRRSEGRPKRAARREPKAQLLAVPSTALLCGGQLKVFLKGFNRIECVLRVVELGTG